MELARLRTALSEGRLELEVDRLRSLLGVVEADLRILQQVRGVEGEHENYSENDFLLAHPGRRKQILAQGVKSVAACYDVGLPQHAGKAALGSQKALSPVPSGMLRLLKPVRSATELRRSPVSRSPVPSRKNVEEEHMVTAPLCRLCGRSSEESLRAVLRCRLCGTAGLRSLSLSSLSMPPNRRDVGGVVSPCRRECARQVQGAGTDTADGLLQSLAAAGIQPSQIAALKASEAKLQQVSKVPGQAENIPSVPGFSPPHEGRDSVLMQMAGLQQQSLSSEQLVRGARFHQQRPQQLHYHAPSESYRVQVPQAFQQQPERALPTCPSRPDVMDRIIAELEEAGAQSCCTLGRARK
eukprot:TRINITY_DN30167_c0_g1_i1.p1 TRINITY_DN30167_c0_g1~~TRINITY_DN30167_c0_g1_i1.p1  ORF type:complete len:354 (+),score=66.14 TRINITY_DN30167_c0_g1_i1:129-1190(+)